MYGCGCFEDGADLFCHKSYDRDRDRVARLFSYLCMRHDDLKAVRESLYPQQLSGGRTANSVHQLIAVRGSATQGAEVGEYGHIPRLVLMPDGGVEDLFPGHCRPALLSDVGGCVQILRDDAFVLKYGREIVLLREVREVKEPTRF